MAQPIDINNPSLANIVEAVRSTPAQHSTAQNSFMGAQGEEIDHNVVLATIKAMFSDGRLPQNSCLGTVPVVSVLRAIGCNEPTFDAATQTNGYNSTTLANMKNRISGVKISLTKTLRKLHQQQTAASGDDTESGEYESDNTESGDAAQSADTESGDAAGNRRE